MCGGRYGSQKETNYIVSAWPDAKCEGSSVSLNKHTTYLDLAVVDDEHLPADLARAADVVPGAVHLGPQLQHQLPQ